MKKILYIILGLGILLMVHHTCPSIKNITPTMIQDYLMQFGVWAPVVYILLFTFVPLTLFPDALLAIAAGFAFGPWWGGLYTLIGALSGGSLAYGIAYRLSPITLHNKLSHYPKLQRLIAERAFYTIFILRLIPLIPFDIISYASGITRASYKDYIKATSLGILPGIALLVQIGDGLTEPNNPRLYIAISCLLALMVWGKHMKSQLLAQ